MLLFFETHTKSNRPVRLCNPNFAAKGKIFLGVAASIMAAETCAREVFAVVAPLVGQSV